MGVDGCARLVSGQRGRRRRGEVQERCRSGGVVVDGVVGEGRVPIEVEVEVRSGDGIVRKDGICDGNAGGGCR